MKYFFLFGEITMEDVKTHFYEVSIGAESVQGVKYLKKLDADGNCFEISASLAQREIHEDGEFYFYGYVIQKLKSISKKDNVYKIIFFRNTGSKHKLLKYQLDQMDFEDWNRAVFKPAFQLHQKQKKKILKSKIEKL